MPSKSELPGVARDVGVPERTLRRAVQRGTARGRRLGPRRVAFDAPERAYLRANWPIISAVAEVLRTERNVRLAVLFGSTARGDARDGSDVDMLVSLADDRPMYTQHLAVRLEERLGSEVDVVTLERLRERDPFLLSVVLREGRPVIDRDELWYRLLADRDRIERAGEEARVARHRRAAAAVAELIGEV
jgi:predicted nucleotidyltransferase